MPALDTGMALGADGLEIDVQLSADGMPVVIHDHLLDRIRWARHNGLDRSVATVSDQAAKAQSPGLVHHGPPVPDTLDPSANLEPQYGPTHGHTDCA